MRAQCLMNNCRKSAPDAEAFCAEHRDTTRVEIPFAFCCAQGGGDPAACDCVSRDHGIAIVFKKGPA